MTHSESTTTSGGLRPDRSQYGLIIADAASQRADCTRSRVGAAIFSTDGRVQALGYNGSAPGRVGCLSSGGCPRAQSDAPPYADYDDCIAVHAEANAIIHGDYAAMKGGTIYVTRKPCYSCRKLIQGAGLARVVFPDEDGKPVVELA